MMYGNPGIMTIMDETVVSHSGAYARLKEYFKRLNAQREAEGIARQIHTTGYYRVANPKAK